MENNLNLGLGVASTLSRFSEGEAAVCGPHLHTEILHGPEIIKLAGLGNLTNPGRWASNNAQLVSASLRPISACFHCSRSDLERCGVTFQAVATEIACVPLRRRALEVVFESPAVAVALPTGRIFR
jgi:hypothetical protein